MQMQVRIRRETLRDGREALIVESPYHPDFPVAARQLGGRWSTVERAPGSRRTSSTATCGCLGSGACAKPSPNPRRTRRARLPSRGAGSSPTDNFPLPRRQSPSDAGGGHNHYPICNVRR